MCCGKQKSWHDLGKKVDGRIILDQQVLHCRCRQARQLCLQLPTLEVSKAAVQAHPACHRLPDGARQRGGCMKLENRVCSLESGKKLKELGIKQDSYLYWVGWYGYSTETINMTFSVKSNSEIKQIERDYHIEKICSAFTVAELGEMLPRGFYSIKYVGAPEYIKDKNNKIQWTGGYLNHHWMCGKIYETNEYEQSANTEADARAKMLIYLIENKIIKVEDL